MIELGKLWYLVKYLKHFPRNYEIKTSSYFIFIN